MPVSAKVAAGMVEGSWIRRMFEGSLGGLRFAARQSGLKPR